jgi:ferredoxin-nitrite reductase
MDNVRNIVGSPLAGIDVDEIVDTREYCYLMNDYIADLGKGHKEISHLPRKFNVSIVVSLPVLSVSAGKRGWRETA